MKGLILLAMLASAGMAQAQSAFAVASIRPSSESVQFERDGETKVTPGSVIMHDVTIETCIKWAYDVQKPQVSGPDVLTADHYDIIAKADGQTKIEEMKKMMQTLLAERFKLQFHKEKKELHSYGLFKVKDSAKLHPAGKGEVFSRQNSDLGTTATAITMQEFSDFLAGPVEKPVVDKTGLPGRWDLSFDFTKYLTDQPKGPGDFIVILNETLQGEIGLKLETEKDTVDVMVVDRVEAPSEN